MAHSFFLAQEDSLKSDSKPQERHKEAKKKTPETISFMQIWWLCTDRKHFLAFVGVTLRYFDITHTFSCFFFCSSSSEFGSVRLNAIVVLINTEYTHCELVVDGFFTFKTIKCVRMVVVVTVFIPCALYLSLFLSSRLIKRSIAFVAVGRAIRMNEALLQEHTNGLYASQFEFEF